MKKVYVVRHADKDPQTGHLTDIGRARARDMSKTLGAFDIVIGSDRPRITETAELLTGTKPRIDERAGFVYMSKEQGQRLSSLAKVHPLSHAGALYDNPEFADLAQSLGKTFIALVKDVLDELPSGGVALIVSQDGVMVAARHDLTGKFDKAFKPLDGFIVNDDLTLRDL